MDTEKFSVTYDLDTKDLLAFNEFHLGKSKTAQAQKRSTYLWSIIVSFGILLWIPLSDDPGSLAPWLGTFLLIYWYLIWSATQRRPTKTIQALLNEGSNRSLYGKRTVTIGPQDVSENMRFADFRFDWLIIEKVLSESNYLFIYTSAVGALIVPRRAFETEAEFDRFCGLARQFHSSAAPGICKKCGYDLTGISQDLCPECGTSFERAQ